MSVLQFNLNSILKQSNIQSRTNESGVFAALATRTNSESTNNEKYQLIELKWNRLTGNTSKPHRHWIRINTATPSSGEFESVQHIGYVLNETEHWDKVKTD